MTIDGGWLVPYLESEFPDLEFGVVQLPIGPSGRGTVAFTSCLGVTSHSGNTEIAHQVAAILTSAPLLAAWNEHAGEMAPYPSLVRKVLARSPAYEPFVAAIEDAHVWQLPPGSENLVDAFNYAVRKAIYEEAPDEVRESSPSDRSQNPISDEAAEKILIRLRKIAQTLHGNDTATTAE
jgi:multiple sugar transport system substrate-binding protein